jgi:CRISPR-associated protein Cas1
VTLFGYGIGVRVERGHLVLEDGIGSDRLYGRFPRVGHGIERLVIIGNDGSVSLAALRWLADQNIAFAMLERDGRVLAATGPVRSSDAKLRRAQAMANESGAGLEIVRALIQQKLAGQVGVARDGLRDSATADRIAALGEAVRSVETMSAIRALEAQGARDYWSAWQNVVITFPKKDWPRVPDHWRVFGARRSPLTECPRAAVNPANAMLNYLYALLESEARLAAAAMGLDPGLGFLHLDTPTRDSLACDLMEPVRPVVDAFVLDWLSRETLRREWFFEQREGNCRLMAPFVAQLSQTASMWRTAAAPVAEAVAQTLWSTAVKPGSRKAVLATRLTQRHNRAAKGGSTLPNTETAVKPETICRICGVRIRQGGQYCRECAIAVSIETVKKAAPSGWVATQTARAQSARSETKQRHDAERKAWDPARHPSWLTEETYRSRVRPRLMEISAGAIAKALDVTWAYASNVRKGKQIPHPRHWLKLAEMVGYSAGK